MSKSSVYAVGGAVQASGGIYVQRKADEELLAACRGNRYAYVLTTRQVGKTSLMIRAATQLQAEGAHCAIIDLSRIGVNVEAEQWYLSLVSTIQRQMDLSTDAIAWWQASPKATLPIRFDRFLREVVLREIKGSVVIFIDEIDTIRKLPFGDDFCTALRSFFNLRKEETDVFRRLSFVLIGWATPDDLMQDQDRTPFNIGKRIELTDFDLDEAMPLADGLGVEPKDARRILQRVLYWTSGHPYLTLRLCRAMSEDGRRDWTDAEVDRLVADTFFGEKSEKDKNLQFVNGMLTEKSPDLEKVLLAYREVWRGWRRVRDEEPSEIRTHLKLSGVVRRERATLRMRNAIYREVFDDKFIKEHLPVNWPKRLQRAAIAAAAVFVLLLVPLSIYAWTKKNQAEKAAYQAHQSAESERQARIEAEQLRKKADESAESERRANEAAQAERLRALAAAARAEKSAQSEQQAKLIAVARQKEAQASAAREAAARKKADEATKRAEASAASERAAKEKADAVAMAGKTYIDGTAFYINADPKSAIAKFKESMEAYNKAGDDTVNALILYNIASAYENHMSADDPTQAQEYYKKAADAFGAKDVTNQIRALIASGKNYTSTDAGNKQYEKAIESYNQALKLYKENSDKFGDAGAFMSIGDRYRSSKNPAEQKIAIESYEDALQIYSKMNRSLTVIADSANIRLRLAFLYDPADKPKALAEYKQARSLSKEAGDNQTILSYIGLGFDDSPQSQESLKAYFGEILQECQKVGNGYGEAAALSYFGDYYSKKDTNSALDYYQKAYQIYERMGDEQQMSTTFSKINGMLESGDEKSVAAYYTKRAEEYHLAGDVMNEARTLSSAAMYYLNRKKYEQALSYYAQVIEIYPEKDITAYNWYVPVIQIPDDERAKLINDLAQRAEGAEPLVKAGIWRKIGIFYRIFSDGNKALSSDEQAAKFYREAGDHSEEAKTFVSIASHNPAFLTNPSDPDNKLYIDYLERAFQTALNGPDKYIQATILKLLGDAYVSVNRQKAADSYAQALKILESIHDPRTNGAIPDVYNGMINLSSSDKDKSDALNNYRKARQFYQRIGQRHAEATALVAMGDLESPQASKEAISYYEQALLIFKELGNRNQEANVLAAIARRLSDSKESEKRLEYLKRELGVYEAIYDRTRRVYVMWQMANDYKNIGKEKEADDLSAKANELSALSPFIPQP